ncbi:MAG: hypothetical protein J6M12_07390 [Clostridia bacterium]|nr:hypothetical protein [Clostridia bacterium]
MKRNVHFKLFPFILALSLLLAGCSSLYGAPKSIGNGEKRYLTGFYGDLYVHEFERSGHTIAVKGEEYRKVKHNRFELYHGYVGPYSSGTIYCAEDQFEEACRYYADPENFNYYLVIRNVLTITLKDIDTQLFEELMLFASKNAYDPFDSFHNKQIETEEFPASEEYLEKEISFYKASKDDLFRLGRDYTFFIIEGELYLLYFYSGNGEEETVIVSKVPETLSEYFIELASPHL